MKDKLLTHYELIKKRGLITPRTNVHNFVDKMEEEYYEVLNSYADDLTNQTSPSNEFIQECTDLVMVVMNMFQHYSIDFRDELSKNIETQFKRVI